MSALNNSALIGASGSTGYQISRSVRLRSSASAYFNWTSGTPTSGSIFTHSFWVKRGVFGAQQTLISGQRPTNFDRIYFTATDTLVYQWNDGTSNLLYLETTQVFRDPSAWYHIVVATDTTQATSSNRAKIYVNGVQVTAFSTATYPTQNSTSYLNRNATTLNLGRTTTAAFYFDGYLTEVNFIDGQALTPSSFGETNTVTGVWQPKKYAGTYGTNGFYLNFSDNSGVTATTIGKDYSGNGNNWTPNNISVTAGVTYDSMLDVPTQWADGGNGRGNYAVLNPVDKASLASMSDGNLKLTNASAGDGGTRSTITCPAGTCYAELIVGSTTNANSAISFGLISTTVGIGAVSGYNTANAWTIYASNVSQINNSGSITGSGAVFSAGDILQVAFDRTNNRAWVGKNNVWYDSSFGTTGNPSAGTNATFSSIPTTNDLAIFAYAYANSANANFGQRPFAYTPPSGFKALNTLNLPTPTILKGNQYFNANTYSGTAGVAGSVTGVGFQPDLVWVKARNAATGHVVVDSARGVQNGLFTQSTSAEVASNEYLLSFNTDGFSYGISNAYSQTSMVSWNWKEGATQGFDIVTFTSDGSTLQTVAHNLGVSPDMIIVKPRSAVGSWGTYHKNLTSTNFYLNLNSTAAQTNGGAQMWGVSSSNFQLRSSSFIGANGTTAVAYLFAAVSGYSAFGSYTGNGSADGPFVFCGFRPRFVMWKNASAAEAWLIEDTARSTYNEVALELYPSSSGAETAGSSRSPTQQFDFLSNGFKVRGANNQTNGNGNTIIFAAFAENPFKNALAR